MAPVLSEKELELSAPIRCRWLRWPPKRSTSSCCIHVRGYKEEGTTTTPCDMVVLNGLDRFHLVADVIDRGPKLGSMAAYVKQAVRDKRIEHKEYIVKHGDDMPEVRDWKWPGA